MTTDEAGFKPLEILRVEEMNLRADLDKNDKMSHLARGYIPRMGRTTHKCCLSATSHKATHAQAIKVSASEVLNAVGAGTCK